MTDIWQIRCDLANIRRRTFWFRLTAFGVGHICDPVKHRLGTPLAVPRGAHEKTVLIVRTMRGIWGEWW